MKKFKYILLFSCFFISCLLVYIYNSYSSFELKSFYEPLLDKYFAQLVKKLNNKHIKTGENYDIYIANFSSSSWVNAPQNNNKKSIIWLGSNVGQLIFNLKKYDYVFATSPLLYNFLKENKIKAYYVPLGYFEEEEIKKDNDNELMFGIIGNPLYVKDILIQRNIKYRQYSKNDEVEIVNDINKLDAVFVEDTAFFEQSLDLHPIFFKLGYNKVPIATYWDWPFKEENINMFNDFINFYMEKDDLNILIDEIVNKDKAILNRSSLLYKLIKKEYFIDSISDRIEHILTTNSDFEPKIDDNSINFDLGVAVGHIGSGDFWLVKDLSDVLIKEGFEPSMTFFNSFYKYKTNINVIVSGFLPSDRKNYFGKSNVLYIAYPMFGNDGKKEFIKNIDEYAKDISDLKSDIDAIAVASKSFNDELNKRGIKSYFIPQFTNTSKFFPDFNEELKSEVFFVGVNSFYRKAPSILLDAKLPITIYGPNWPDGVSKGEYLDNRILRKYYSSAKIVLNDTREGMKQFGFISNRIFDASACGTLVISDYVKEIEDVYGDSVPMWKTNEELVELVKYYLDPKNEKERLEKAQRAKEITLKNFTSDIVGKKFESMIKEVRKR